MIHISTTKTATETDFSSTGSRSRVLTQLKQQVDSHEGFSSAIAGGMLKIYKEGTLVANVYPQKIQEVQVKRKEQAARTYNKGIYQINNKSVVDVIQTTEDLSTLFADIFGE